MFVSTGEPGSAHLRGTVRAELSRNSSFINVRYKVGAQTFTLSILEEGLREILATELQPGSLSPSVDSEVYIDTPFNAETALVELLMTPPLLKLLKSRRDILEAVASLRELSPDV